MTGIILAGGKASRMGGLDKAFVKVANTPIIERQLKVFDGIFGEIIIVTNSRSKYRGIKGKIRGIKGIKIIPDVVRGLGPLGGMYSGLLASDSFYNFVVACDMPFINEALVKYMIKKRDAYDVVIPKIGGRFHPLFGIYSKRCIPIIKERLEKKELRIAGIFSKVKRLFISKKEIEKFDRSLLSLVNVNTREDMVKIKKRKGT